ncbi:MAG: endonuclease/exonuclease/phosphatase family protein [Candidatus Eremiobacteraeota bacterium]|nr:endonuclease/exonuclease/phosphatase family protein [Candidatus Eremiobacteraeota bacterium]
MRVLTFNLRCDMPPVGWSQRRADASALVRHCEPDVVGFQEALPHQRADLEHDLPDYQAYGIGRDAGGGGEQCCLFVRSGIELLSQGTFWFGPHPDRPGSRAWDAMFPRICSWVRLLWSGREVTVANVHLDHEGETARQQAAAQLASWLRPPCVLMGDFNAEPDSVALTNLRQWLTDAYFCIHGGWLGTYHEFAGGHDGPCIDHILVSGLQVASAEVVVSGPPYPSDHHPVLATLDL